MVNYNASKVIEYVDSVPLATGAVSDEPQINMVSGSLASDGTAGNCFIAGDVELGYNSYMTACVVGEGVHLRIGHNCVLQGCVFLSGDIVIGHRCRMGGVFEDGLARLEIGDDSSIVEVDLRMPDCVALIGARCKAAYLQMTLRNTHIHIGDDCTMFRYAVHDPEDITPEACAKVLPIVIGNGFTLCPQNVNRAIDMESRIFPVILATDMERWRYESGKRFVDRKMGTEVDLEIQLFIRPKGMDFGNDVYIGVGIISKIPGKISLGAGARLNGSASWSSISSETTKSIKFIVKNLKLATRAQMTVLPPTGGTDSSEWAYPGDKYLGSLELGYESNYVVRNNSCVVKQVYQDTLIPPKEVYME